MPTRRFQVLLNAAAGRAEGGPDALRGWLRRECRAKDILLEFIEFDGADAGARLSLAVRSKQPDAVLAVGGDGTARTAASALLAIEPERRPPLAVLPLGTANLIARDLGVPTEPTAAVAAIAEASPCRMDVGLAGREPFLAACVIGVFPTLARHRESFRGRGPLVRTRSLMTMAADFLRYPPLELEIDGAGMGPTEGTGTRRTRALAVSVGEFDAHAGWLPRRRSLDAGCLGVVVASDLDRPRLVMATLGLFSGHWLRSDSIERRRVRSLGVGSPGRRSLRLMVDGELLRLPAPVRFAFDPAALVALRVDPRP